LPATESPLPEAYADAARALEICNACRYCEGYCAVFPAMELRRDFAEGDLNYLANLCHGCRGCYHACQYAPPHEFGINLPRNFSAIRAHSYEQYAWPAPLARLFRRNGLVVTLAATLGIILALFLTMALTDPAVMFAPQRGPGAFYAIIPYELMVALGTATFGFALVALGMGFRNFWRESGRENSDLTRPGPLGTALHDALTLKNLGGGGHGCNDTDEGFSQSRRHLHHALFYGFMLCFAATSIATVMDHGFGWIAPYSWYSAPVVLGTLGGIGMMVGSVGLFALKLKADPAPAAPSLLGMDTAMLGLLFAIAATGLLLLVLRHTGAMGTLLAIHLGVVFAFFLVIPYSKMVHGVYRGAALLRNALEQRGH
jgi:citrate/tricarballylate utilization protein